MPSELEPYTLVHSLLMTPVHSRGFWCHGGAASLAVLGCWSLYRLYLRARRRRLLQLERARRAERERIARDLHDTLLQSVHAMILRVDTIAGQLPLDTPLRITLEDMLADARAASREARDLIQDLRAHADGDVDLASTLRAAADHVCGEFGRACTVVMKGDPFQVSARQANACCRIVVESLRNAFGHAQASRVTLEFEFVQHAIWVSVVDDGIGMTASADKSAPGRHWGIVGMRERAAEVGARLQIASMPGHGTRLRLELPRSASLPDAGIRHTARRDTR